MGSCNGCKFWSERLAQSNELGNIEALCLSSDSPHAGRWVLGGCRSYEAGAAIDDPAYAFESVETDD